jgi:hypothetical protein
MNMQGATLFRFTSADEAVMMIRMLLGSGVQPGEIEVLSSEPIPEIESLISGKSRLPVFVISGAVVGITAGFLLASGTARLYPINTGGMPTVSLLPVGIVTYEAMMLFAVLFAVAGLLLEARLPRRIRADSYPYAQSVADGEIVVLARVSAPMTAEGLQAAGASNSNHKSEG